MGLPAIAQRTGSFFPSEEIGNEKDTFPGKFPGADNDLIIINQARIDSDSATTRRGQDRECGRASDEYAAPP